jgi:hypothetical protein
MNDRSNGQDTTTSRIPTHDIPPQEVRVVSQVPYTSRSPTPPPTNSGMPKHQAPRSLRSHSDSHTKPQLATSIDPQIHSDDNSPVSQSAWSTRWTKRRHTSAFPPSRTSLAPYETALDLPTGAENIRHRSFMDAVNPPPSPPDSPSSCNKADTSASRDVRSKVLPGTMSSQASTVRDGSRTRSIQAQDRASTARSQSEQRPMGKRLTSAFRDMFKKEPVDENRFERISDRHWSEES